MKPQVDERTRKTMGFWLGLPLMLVFLVAGSVGAYKGGSGLWLERELRERGVAVTVEVSRSVARNSGTQSNDRRSWRDVSYQFDVDSTTYRNTIEIDAYKGPPLVGQEIVVHYLPEDPTQNWPLRYDRAWWNWFALGFGSLIAAFSAFVVVGMIFVSIRDARHHPEFPR